MWGLVFLITVLLDIIGVWYLKSLDDDDITQSVVSSGIGAAMVGFATIVYVADNWLLIPEILGNLAGAYAAVKLRRLLEFMQFLEDKNATS